MLLCYTPILGKLIPATNFGAGIPDLDPLRALAYLLVMVFAFEYSVGGRAGIWHRWLGIMITYVLVVSMSPLWSPVYSYNPVVVQELFNSVILPMFVAAIALVLFRSEDVVRRYCFHLAIASVILSVIALVQFVQGSSIINEQARSMATFNNPNLLAVYLVLSLAVVLYATDTKKIGARFGYVVQILLVLAMFTTISRKGLGTMGITFILYYWATKRKRNLALIATVIAVVAVFAAGVSQFSSRFKGDVLEHQFEGKASMAMAGIEMFTDSPLIGLGYRGYYENFGVYLPNGGRAKYDAHNEYVTALANYGLIGFGPFLAVFLFPLIWGWKRMRSLPPPAVREERLRVLVGIISVVTFMMSQFYAGHLFYQNIVVFLLYANVALMLTTPATTESAGAESNNALGHKRPGAGVRILRYRAEKK
jgi:O-antigen ligase